MRFLRQKRCKEAFEALMKQENTLLEHPQLTELYNKLVDHGDFDAVESIIRKSYTDNLFSENMRKCSYTPEWELLHSSSPSAFVCVLREMF